MSEASRNGWFPRTYQEKVEALEAHLKRHGLKDWLLKGAYNEDACTIHAAVTCIRSDALVRRLARALAKAWDGKVEYLRDS
jgi:hypothetical protein